MDYDGIIPVKEEPNDEFIKCEREPDFNEEAKEIIYNLNPINEVKIERDNWYESNDCTALTDILLKQEHDNFYTAGEIDDTESKPDLIDLQAFVKEKDSYNVKSDPENVCSESLVDSSIVESNNLKITGQNIPRRRRKTIHCPICFKVLNSDLKRHLLVHTGEKSHICKICGKTAADNSNLRAHMKIHTGEKTFECSDCGKKFISKTHLKIHSIVHTGVKNYNCKYCGKSFGNSTHLNGHIKVHTGEKNYICAVCSKGFPNNSQLKKHFITHTGERNYKCDQCPKAFSQRNNLKSHLMKHAGVIERNFLCSLCSKTFVRNFDLKRHLTSHAGERNYQCEVCSKRFRESAHLKTHMNIHTKELRFSCEYCKKDFLRKSHLKSHLIRIHGEENTNSAAATTQSSAIEGECREEETEADFLE